MELLRKPEPANLNSRNLSENADPAIDPRNIVSENVISVPTEKEMQWASDNFTFLVKPMNVKDETFANDQELNGLTSMTGPSSESMRETELLNVDSDVPHFSTKEQDGDSDIGSQLRDYVLNEEKMASALTFDADIADSVFKSSPPHLSKKKKKKSSPPPASLLKKQRRLEKPAKVVPYNDGLQTSEEKFSCEDYDANVELASLSTASSLDVLDHEDADWARAEYLVKTGEKVEVELLRSSTRGFVVSFGSLIGILPYRNLAAKWKFLAFESLLRQKGLETSMYRQNLGVIGSYDSADNNASTTGGLDQSNISVNQGEISSDMKLEDLLKIYDREELKFLSTFIGQKLKVSVVMADRRFRKLIVSLKPRERRID